MLWNNNLRCLRNLWEYISNLRYDGPQGVREHIVEMVNLAENSKKAKMTMSYELLRQIVLNSLPSTFEPFVIEYNLKGREVVYE